MSIAISPAAGAEQRAVCELVDRFGAAWRPREPEAELRIAGARSELAGSGLWALGLPEADGGGGADGATAALAIARVSGYWPALGLGMAHLHAAGVALTGSALTGSALTGSALTGSALTGSALTGAAVAGGPPAGTRPLHAAAEEGRPIAVVEAPAAVLARGAGPVCLDRVDVGDPGCDLILVHAEGCLFVPGGHAEFGPARRRTGLDGATSVAVTVPEGAATEIGRDAGASDRAAAARVDASDRAGAARVDASDRAGAARADAVRAALYAGLMAVAAGLTDAAQQHARDYAAGRVQFGAPLTALPTMRDQLSGLRGRAVALLATAMYPPSGASDAAAALRAGLDVAVDVAGAALGCLGGYGYLEEYPLAGLFRDAISLRAAASPGW